MNKDAIILRNEKEEDYRAVEELTREAFWNHHSPGCDEHYLVHIMRGAEAFIKELDFVAEYEGQIVGNIMYTKAFINGDDGREHLVLTFGPIAVLPEFQRFGIGRKLIEYSRKVATELGYTAIIIMGDPDIYKRVGFTQAKEYGIGTAWDTYADALLAYELVEGALKECAGKFVEDLVYQIDKTAAEAFDQSFIPKERIAGLASQARFEELVRMNIPRNR